ncbi:MAG: hypothetical protein HFI89_02555 [Lachnospiraceae bacterium]|nr:hypothetical protein [Lachnospiraceae bacterium]
MRKTQKKQAEAYIRLLGQAHLEIKKALETKKYELARDLLGQCQDSAIELGNMIEQAEGEGAVTVPFLEEYCELLYQIHEEIWQRSDEMSHQHISPAASKQKLDTGRLHKALKKQLTQIENSIKNDISVQTEAVFLPYKASMWDSLESVWQAAAEDPNCTAYVIPIPYYDKNPDGSLKEMHYEGDLYPPYVPVTDYREYDFAEHRPDLVFIHNPYDNSNYVTSVHPFFYSDNIKQFTDQLVYIPYFILGEVDPENKEAVKGMRHFCTVPAVINADKVIVQSEAMRRIYVNVMTEETAKNENSARQKEIRKYWEEKIDGSGSPKVDKVLRTSREGLDIPEEWLRLIQKPDGSWKKIIFYNTSVSALLQHGEKMLEKMRDVFKVFKENRDEVALLWRPHPLIKATIESMRPGLWEEYEKLVDRYLQEGWGIYDDTADVDRAIVLCDAYYGDSSSLVRLCQEKGRPVMIQNVEIVAANV